MSEQTLTDEQIIADFLTIAPHFKRRKDWKETRISVIAHHRKREEQWQRLQVKRAKRAEKVADIYCETDGGRSTSGLDEARDCSVRALSVLFGLDYLGAHKLCEKAGRIPGRGMTTMELVDAVQKAGKRYEMIDGGGTIEGFIKNHPTGRYLILTVNHCAAVVEGKLHDNGDTTLYRVKSAIAILGDLWINGDWKQGAAK